MSLREPNSRYFFKSEVSKSIPSPCVLLISERLTPVLRLFLRQKACMGSPISAVVISTFLKIGGNSLKRAFNAYVNPYFSELSLYRLVRYISVVPSLTRMVIIHRTRRLIVTVNRNIPDALLSESGENIFLCQTRQTNSIFKNVQAIIFLVGDYLFNGFHETDDVSIVIILDIIGKLCHTLIFPEAMTLLELLIILQNNLV